MIDISEVHKLENIVLEQRLANERETQKRQNAKLEETRKENIALAEKSKKAAEQKLPEILKKIEEDIKYTVGCQQRYTTIYCYGELEYEAMYLQLLLMEILPLQGFICKIKGNQIEVSW